jgi:hypothetical protein
LCQQIAGLTVSAFQHVVKLLEFLKRIQLARCPDDQFPLILALSQYRNKRFAKMHQPSSSAKYHPPSSKQLTGAGVDIDAAQVAVHGCARLSPLSRNSKPAAQLEVGQEQRKRHFQPPVFQLGRRCSSPPLDDERHVEQIFSVPSMILALCIYFFI